MGCNCKKSTSSSSDTENKLRLINIDESGAFILGPAKSQSDNLDNVNDDRSLGVDDLAYIRTVDLPRCYNCTLKHLGAAKILFREYHTGYPRHLKNLLKSLQCAEDGIRTALTKYLDIMAELSMAEAELIGSMSMNRDIDKEHIDLANRIRDERLRLEGDPLYVPRFSELQVDTYRLLQLTITDT